ncbi:MAG TPA: hypothetical protein VFL83_00520 [Anaeromyxobacter sp.]|nr:hypothetical protein [Anaeromyxobacter sp.]
MAGEALALCALLLASPGASPLSVEVRPPFLTLGYAQRAHVVVRSAAGAPRVEVSAGTLGPLAQAAPGVWEADLDPPLEGHPQLAIVVAVADDALAFAALPLVGQGVAVATTEPNARISVRIRDREFGPVQADASGTALVPVEVPPGERHAWQRGRALDLRVPPLRQVHVVLGRGEVRADREETVRVFAVAARPDGAPWAGEPPALSAAAGALGATKELVPGAWAATWTLPPGAAGDVAVQARLPDVPLASAALRRAPGPAARVALRLARDRAVAGGEPVEAVAEVTDAAGNRVDGEVRLAARFGTISSAGRGGPGIVTARWQVPERLEGRSEATVEATLGDAVDRRTIALAPGAPTRIAVAVEPPEVVADGEASTEVRVAVSDRFGNGVAGEVPALDAGRGRLAPLEEQGPGRWRTRYTARWAPRGGADTVVARAGTVEETARVLLLDPPRRLAATARAGVLHASGGFTAPTLGAALELWPLRLAGAYGLAGGIAFARTSRDEAAAVGGGTHALASAVELWPVTLTGLARRTLARRITGTVGAGAGIVAVHSTVSLDGGAAADEWGRALAVHATAGAALEMPAWHARVRLDAVLAWQDDAGMRSFRGSLTTLSVTVGVSHDAL